MQSRYQLAVSKSKSQIIMNKGIQKDSWIGVGAIVVLAVWSLALFLFALMSGAEATNGTVSGLVGNTPNALPWLIPIVLTYVAWKRQVIGGTLFVLFGLATIIFFSTYESMVALLIISVPAIVFGMILLTQTIWDRSLKLANELPLGTK